MAKPERLTKGQAHCLRNMAHRDLAYGWGGKRATRVVRDLEEMGYARVTFPDADRRWRASITPAGRRALEEATDADR